MTRRLRTVAARLLALALASHVASAQFPIARVSVSSSGEESNDMSYRGSISSDGRYVVFMSSASNLVAGDTNGELDVFRHDLRTRATVRVSVATDGAQADGWSGVASGAAVSADGRYVAFYGDAPNLVHGDTNGKVDIFVRDMESGTTTRLSTGAGGVESDGDSLDPAITEDGSRVVFLSRASNLVAPAISTAFHQVYVRDVAARTCSLVSVSPSGAEADALCISPCISGDGRFVAFDSSARNLVPIDPRLSPYLCYLRDLVTGTTRLAVSTHDLREGRGGVYNPCLSRDGSRLAFLSNADLVPGDFTGMTHAYVLETSTDEIRRASQGDVSGSAPKISPGGRFVAFGSVYPDFVPDDEGQSYDTFVHDLSTSATVRISVAPDGSPGRPANIVDQFVHGMSGDGRFVVLDSYYANLVPDDGNGVNDIFVVDRGSPRSSSYCVARTDSAGCVPSISSLGSASGSSGASFLVEARPVLDHRLGILVYGLTPDRSRFEGGVRCVALPHRRAAAVSSGGTSGGPNCSGALSADFNALLRSGRDPALVPGTVVFAQWLYRDPSGAGRGSSDAIRFVIEP